MTRRTCMGLTASLISVAICGYMLVTHAPPPDMVSIMVGFFIGLGFSALFGARE